MKNDSCTVLHLNSCNDVVQAAKTSYELSNAKCIEASLAHVVRAEACLLIPGGSLNVVPKHPSNGSEGGKIVTRQMFLCKAYAHPY